MEFAKITEFMKYVSGSTEPWTAKIVAAIAAAKAAKPYACLLETGTYKGLTTERIYDAIYEYQGAVLHTVDSGEAPDTGLKFVYHRDKLIPHQGDALQFIKDWEGASFDFVFLDDDHNDVHVNEEIWALKRDKLAGGAVILIHDVIGPFNLDTVVRNHGGYILELPLLHKAGGLGIIQL